MIAFVERKPIDWGCVQGLLRRSEDANQWSNFGPVGLELERRVGQCLRLGPSLAVVATASGTAALFALVELQQHLAGRALRWAVSSFGFPCTVMGPLRHAVVVDCTPDGVLDLDVLPHVDGLVVTNPFGLYPDLDSYRAHCRRHGLVLVIDSCAAFDSAIHGAGEALSFHHTKPWGFGEGGAMIVPREHQDLARSLVNFGQWHGLDVGRRAANGKLSEVAAAFIAQRLEALPSVSPVSRAQYERIAGIGSDFDLHPLGGVTRFAGTPFSVPLLACDPVTDLENEVVKLQKYYRPLGPTPVATALYDRIVNVPCHPDMAALTDADLVACFRQIAAQTRGTTCRAAAPVRR